MSQSNNTTSSQDTNEDNRTGPFCVQPKYDCPHLGDHVYVLAPSAQNENGGQPACVDCNETHENWACLHQECNYIGCSRYKNKHMMSHHQTTGHNICLSFSDNSVFCYACDSYIDGPQLHALSRQLNRIWSKW